ncbi:MAG: hypothetical protein VW518_00740 [Burkholderiaceae bacterium]
MANRYRSGSEVKTANFLNNLKIPFEFESQYINYTWLEDKKYLPDFILPNGIIIEVKGRFTRQDRKKHLFIRNQYPYIDIRFVFDNPRSKLNKGGKSSYGDWCDKNEFKYCSLAELFVIEEWANEGKEKSTGGRLSTRTSASSRQENKSRESTVSKRSATSTVRRHKTSSKKRTARRRTSS